MYVQYMALPLRLVKELPPSVFAGVGAPEDIHALSDGSGSFSGLRLGHPELEQALPEGGLLRGAVTELAVRDGSALSTSVALGACRTAQEEALVHGGEAAWCAFIDTSGTLHAPGVAQKGLDLSRLLVVRPDAEALKRVVVRLAESRVFAVLVVDLTGVPGREHSPNLGSWPRVIRRLSMAIQGTQITLVLLTEASAARPLPLPVAQRIELSRPDTAHLKVQVVKDRQGRIGSPCLVPSFTPSFAPGLSKVTHEIRHDRKQRFVRAQ